MLTAVAWAIDANLSTTTIAIPDQPYEQVSGTTTYSDTLQVRNTVGGDSGPWNVGNTAQLAGTLETEYTLLLEVHTGNVFQRQERHARRVSHFVDLRDVWV